MTNRQSNHSCSGETQRTMHRAFFMLFLLAALILACSVQSHFTPVQAAATKTVRTAFQDGSGKYLEKRGANWYLYGPGRKPLGGLQYLNIQKTGSLTRGFYAFDKKGRLVQKTAVYKLNRTVNGVRFSGFYCTNRYGRFLTNGNVLIKLPRTKCAGLTFQGYYFRGAYGKLSAPAQVRFLNQKIGSVSFRGYYYFSRTGKLYTNKAFHSLNQTIGRRTFRGTYYFGGRNGLLTVKKGWITYKNEKYYLDANGKMAVNCWRSGYYLLSNGKIARNQKLPDGTYVDYEGRKCSGADMALQSLKRQLQQTIRGYSGSWSVYVKDLSTNAAININETSMYPASTIKAFVMASTFDRIQSGKLSYNSSIKTLLNDMITVSDNESFNVLVRRSSSSGSFAAGAAEINKYLKKNGYTKTGCHSSLHPAASAFASDGGRNTSSAKDCGLLLERIYRGKCVSSKYSKEMLNLLCRQTRRWKIPSGVPSGVKIANKTGETSSVQHDMAIVYGPETHCIICVFSSGCGESSAISGIRNISRMVYNYLN